jgi:MoaA/NifB/PqqE/SkfB family radical SAM enzyme
MKDFPDIVFLKLTSKCNHNCKYCYDFKEHPDMSISQLKKIFQLLSKKGVKALVLTGGEPLIREDIPKIFSEIKKYGIKIYLDTNGDFFFKYERWINKYVDILGLPLDYPSEENYYRSKKNFRNVYKILKDYSIKEKNFKIRIGTVVTKENIVYLKEIAELLKRYKPDSWKIYQFIPRGPNGFVHKDQLRIDTKTFFEVADNIKARYSKYLNIIVSSRESRNRAYFFINSDGVVFMPLDDPLSSEDVNIGNILEKGIIEKWQKIVNMGNYTENIKKTFI